MHGNCAVFDGRTLTHSLTIVSAFSAMGNGTSAMFETMIVTILVASIGALIKENGGFEWLLLLIRKVFKGRNGGAAWYRIFDIAYGYCNGKQYRSNC